jgi:hypothetical protein
VESFVVQDLASCGGGPRDDVSGVGECSFLGGGSRGWCHLGWLLVGGSVLM